MTATDAEAAIATRSRTRRCPANSGRVARTPAADSSGTVTSQGVQRVRQPLNSASSAGFQGAEALLRLDREGQQQRRDRRLDRRRR